MTSPEAGVLKSALLVLRESPAYSQRIVIVAGTQSPGNILWDVDPADPSGGSNLFTGSTDLAAPALNVATDDSAKAGGVVDVVYGDGTSMAAPMVAGLAGLILSIDPTLSPAQVKDYLVRGAQAPRQDSLTGGSTAPSPVSGAPGVYQMDMYGTLALLAKEHPGTPQ